MIILAFIAFVAAIGCAVGALIAHKLFLGWATWILGGLFGGGVAVVALYFVYCSLMLRM